MDIEYSLQDNQAGTVPIIIPAYEPDDRLDILLKDLYMRNIGPILIVDDGSSDEYRHFFDAAEETYYATVLRHKTNAGKGRALKTAFSYCLENYSDFLGGITADSDGQHTPDAIIKCKDVLVESFDKLVLGVRSFDGDDVPIKSQFGNNLTRKVFKMLYGVSISDTQTGLRGIPKEFMSELLKVSGERFEFETRMLIKAAEMGVQIQEVPIETVYDSKENHATHFRPIVDSIRIYRAFWGAFGKFCLASISSSLIDFLGFYILCWMLRYSSLGIKYVAVATVGARIISSIFNFSMNYFLVFQSKNPKAVSAIKYFLLAITQMVCSAVLTTVLVEYTGTDKEVLMKIPVDVVLFLISYQMQKKFIFK